MLPSLSLLSDSSSRRRSNPPPSQTDLYVVLKDSSSKVCTLHSVYIISFKLSDLPHPWNSRYANLMRSFSTGAESLPLPEPVNYVEPYIISDETVKEEVSHLNAYGSYLFTCGSRSTHMTYSYRAALGCALAHLRVWNSIANCSRPFCLVVEDNVYFGEGTPAALVFYEQQFKELNADYMMLHTLGAFQDYCKQTEGKEVLSKEVEYYVPFKGKSIKITEKLFALDRPMMSTKCYFISKNFAQYMYDMLYDMYQANQMPPIHIDALLSLEALRGKFRAFHRFPSTAPQSEDAGVFDNVDATNPSFISILKKPQGQGIPHTTPVASRGAEAPPG